MNINIKIHHPKVYMNIIQQIKQYNPNLIWEIDSTSFYKFIAWDGVPGKSGECEWLTHIMEKATFKELKELLTALYRKANKDI